MTVIDDYAEREIRANLATRQGFGDSAEWIARDYRRFARQRQPEAGIPPNLRLARVDRAYADAYRRIADEITGEAP